MGDGAQGTHTARDYNHRIYRKGSAGNAGTNVVVIENFKLFPAIAHKSLDQIAQGHWASPQLLVKHSQPSRRGDKLNPGHTALGSKMIQKTVRIDGAAGASNGYGNVHARIR